MSTDAVTPLRQRMIEDMNARKLGAHSQRSHISSCWRFAAFLKRSPDNTGGPEDETRPFAARIAAGSCSPAKIGFTLAIAGPVANSPLGLPQQGR
jgi:hypothetical protein